jgi:F-type H+-transporting ATPase subunit b
MAQEILNTPDAPGTIISGPLPDANAPVVAETHGTVAHESGHEPAPKALGLDATGWVALAMLVLLGIMLWKRVPAMVGKMLDSQIDGIRKTLDDAAKLRSEAEALKAEYEAKRNAATKEASEIVEAARNDAATLISNASTQADAMVARRTAMAETKIAAAQRAAIDDVRAIAAQAATAAAQKIIAEKLDGASRDRLVDQAIGELDRRIH